MDLETALGRYIGLQRALAAAYEARPWPISRIDELAAKLATTEREIASSLEKVLLSRMKKQIHVMVRT